MKKIILILSFVFVAFMCNFVNFNAYTNDDVFYTKEELCEKYTQFDTGNPDYYIDENNPAYNDVSNWDIFQYDDETKNIFSSNANFTSIEIENKTKKAILVKDDDPIVKFIPKCLFQYLGDYSYIGKEYGFHVHTDVLQDDAFSSEGDIIYRNPQTDNFINEVDVFIFDVQKTEELSEFALDITPLYVYTYYYFSQGYLNRGDLNKIDFNKNNENIPLGYSINNDNPRPDFYYFLTTKTNANYDFGLVAPMAYNYKSADQCLLEQPKCEREIAKKHNGTYAIYDSYCSVKLKNTNELNYKDINYNVENDLGTYITSHDIKYKGIEEQIKSSVTFGDVIALVGNELLREGAEKLFDKVAPKLKLILGFLKDYRELCDSNKIKSLIYDNNEIFQYRYDSEYYKENYNTLPRNDFILTNTGAGSKKILFSSLDYIKLNNKNNQHFKFVFNLGNDEKKGDKIFNNSYALNYSYGLKIAKMDKFGYNVECCTTDVMTNETGEDVIVENNNHAYSDENVTKYYSFTLNENICENSNKYDCRIKGYFLKGYEDSFILNNIALMEESYGKFYIDPHGCSIIINDKTSGKEIANSTIPFYIKLGNGKNYEFIISGNTHIEGEYYIDIYVERFFKTKIDPTITDAGTEVSMNGGTINDNKIHVGFSRNLFLGEGAPIDKFPSRLDYNWTSSNSDIASVSKYGTVFGKNPGKVTITVNKNSVYISKVTIEVYSQVTNPGSIKFNVTTDINEDPSLNGTILDYIPTEEEINKGYKFGSGGFDVKAGYTRCLYILDGPSPYRQDYIYTDDYVRGESGYGEFYVSDFGTIISVPNYFIEIIEINVVCTYKYDDSYVSNFTIRLIP